MIRIAPLSVAFSLDPLVELETADAGAAFGFSVLHKANEYRKAAWWCVTQYMDLRDWLTKALLGRILLAPIFATQEGPFPLIPCLSLRTD